MQNQIEITERKPLFDDNGNIINSGFSKRLNWEYDKTLVKASKIRLKEWDYYSISNGKYALCITIADMGYVGALTVSVIDYVTPAHFSATSTKLFTMGKLNLSSDLEKGDISFKKGKTWATVKTENGVRILQGEYPNADGLGNTLKWDVTLSQFPNEYMAIAMPFEKDKHFYLNAKVNCIEAEGSFTIGDMVCPFDKTDTLAVLNWGRGVLPYKNTWYWASLSSTLEDGRLFGLNFGHGFGNDENAAEDIIFVDGKAHKINSRVSFAIGGEKENKPRFIEPWAIKDQLGKVDLTFTPIIDKHNPFNIGLLKISEHQVFGWFDGKCTLEDGTELTINHKIGFAEKVLTKW